MKALLEILKALYSIKDAIVNKKNNSSEGGSGGGSSEDNPFQYLVNSRNYVLPIDEWFNRSSDNNNLLILKKDLTVKDLFPTYTDRWIEILKNGLLMDRGLPYTFNKYDILNSVVASYFEDNKNFLEIGRGFPILVINGMELQSAIPMMYEVEDVISWTENLTEDTILFKAQEETEEPVQPAQ